jgi:iron complex transport system substrate-binding protein
MIRILRLSYSFLYGIIIGSALLSVSCNRETESKSAVPDEQKDHGSTIIYAGRFNIEKLEGYSKITITDPWQGASGVNQVYYLVKRGSKIPAEASKNSVIFVPVRKIICMSTTHVAMISALGEEESVAGISGAPFVCDKKLSEKIKNNEVADVGYDSGINKELIIRINPELIMMYGVGNESAGHFSKISELGFSTIFNADYLETDPLGKAEWIKLFGALYCKEQAADSIFRSVSCNYLRLKDRIKENVAEHPRVLLGLPYKDTWFISPGNSYISRIIADAGGQYLWSETISNISMPYGIENVYIKAMNADFWLNAGAAGNKDYIASLDPRLAALPCYIHGRVYNNNRRMNKNGGNDYWESGSMHPELILRDIASILHPGFIEEDLYYYKKLN